MEIDFDQLRKDIIEFYEGAFFVGGFGAAMCDLSDVYKASNDELIRIANNLNININKYIIKNKQR